MAGGVHHQGGSISRARFVHQHGITGASILPFVPDCLGILRDSYWQKHRHRITYTTCLQFAITDAKAFVKSSSDTDPEPSSELMLSFIIVGKQGYRITQPSVWNALTHNPCLLNHRQGTRHSLRIAHSFVLESIGHWILNTEVLFNIPKPTNGRITQMPRTPFCGLWTTVNLVRTKQK